MAKWNLNNVLLSMIVFDIIFVFLMSSLGSKYISIPTLSFPNNTSITYIENTTLASWGSWDWNILGYNLDLIPAEVNLALIWAYLDVFGMIIGTMFSLIPFLYNIITLPYNVMPYPINIIIEGIFSITVMIGLITGFELFSTRIHGD